MKISCMEWNINGRGGANGIDFPDFIADEIRLKNPDIVILVEFFKRVGWENFCMELSKDYILCLSEDYGPSKNQVLIAIVKKLNPVIENIKSHIHQGRQLLEIPGLEYLHPEFSQADTTIERDGERKHLSVIGTRIKTQDENAIYYNRRKQFELLANHIIGISSPIIVTGDFNHGAIFNEGQLNQQYDRDNEDQRRFYNYQMMLRILGEKYTVGTPGNKAYGKKYSFVMNAKDKKGNSVKIKQDHFISCGLNLLNCDYGWSFVQANPELYNHKQCTDYLGVAAGIPDHAYLYGEFEF